MDDVDLPASNRFSINSIRKKGKKVKIPRFFSIKNKKMKNFKFFSKNLLTNQKTYDTIIGQSSEAATQARRMAE